MKSQIERGPWRTPERKRFLVIFRRSEKPLKKPRAIGQVKELLVDGWEPENPQLFPALYAWSAYNRDQFKSFVQTEGTGSIARSFQNMDILTRLANGDQNLQVKVPLFMPKSYKHFITSFAVEADLRRQGLPTRGLLFHRDFDKKYYPLYVKTMAQRVRDAGIQEFRAGELVGIAAELDRTVAPEDARRQQRAQNARNILAVPAAIAAGIVTFPVPIPGSSLYAGYKTYQFISGKGKKDVFEEGEWWREQINYRKFGKAYRHLVKKVAPVILERKEGAQKPTRVKFSYKKRETNELMRSLYFAQPDEQYFQFDRAVQYYNLTLISAKRSQELGIQQTVVQGRGGKR